MIADFCVRARRTLVGSTTKFHEERIKTSARIGAEAGKTKNAVIVRVRMKAPFVGYVLLQVGNRLWTLRRR